MSTTSKKTDKPTIVKKYANRRLYDTGRSSYVTLEDLCEMLQQGYDFVVVDAKTGEDLTRSVLTQIIAEQEAKPEQNLLPTNFLRQLIGFYNGKMTGLVPNYLEQAMDTLATQQEKFRDQIGKSMSTMGMGNMNMGHMFPGLHALEDMQKKNMEMFENAMRAITPFPMRGNDMDDMAMPTARTKASGLSQPQKTDRAPTRTEKISAVRQQIAELQRELDKLQRQ